jgi:hypothetical protein
MILLWNMDSLLYLTFYQISADIHTNTEIYYTEIKYKYCRSHRFAHVCAISVGHIDLHHMYVQLV